MHILVALSFLTSALATAGQPIDDLLKGEQAFVVSGVDSETKCESFWIFPPEGKNPSTRVFALSSKPLEIEEIQKRASQCEKSRPSSESYDTLNEYAKLRLIAPRAIHQNCAAAKDGPRYNNKRWAFVYLSSEGGTIGQDGRADLILPKVNQKASLLDLGEDFESLPERSKIFLQSLSQLLEAKMGRISEKELSRTQRSVVRSLEFGLAGCPNRTLQTKF